MDGKWQIADLGSSIGIPKTFPKIIFPTLRQCGYLSGAPEKLLVPRIDRVKVHNVCDRDPRFLFFSEFNRVAILYSSFANHGEVKPAPFARKKTFHYVSTIKSNPKLEARHPRLRHHKLR